MNRPVRFLRYVALAEAVSWLVLLVIAMPLKYLADQPLGVRLVGPIHGFLFVLLCWALWRVWRNCAWPLARVAGVFGASFLPLVPFFLDRHLQGWEARESG